VAVDPVVGEGGARVAPFYTLCDIFNIFKVITPIFCTIIPPLVYL
jgi:hypothetical protein